MKYEIDFNKVEEARKYLASLKERERKGEIDFYTINYEGEGSITAYYNYRDGKKRYDTFLKDYIDFYIITDNFKIKDFLEDKSIREYLKLLFDNEKEILEMLEIKENENIKDFILNYKGDNLYDKLENFINDYNIAYSTKENELDYQYLVYLDEEDILFDKIIDCVQPYDDKDELDEGSIEFDNNIFKKVKRND